MAEPAAVGEDYRGVQGRIGFLLVQAQHAFAQAMEDALKSAGLTRVQFATLSVVVRQPGLSSADLSRVLGVTPQAINLLISALEQQQLVERRPHPSHGRILEIHATAEGIRRLDEAYPSVIALEDRILEGFGDRQQSVIKKWLVHVAVATTAPH